MLSVKGIFAQKKEIALSKEWLETNYYGSFAYSNILCLNISENYSLFTIIKNNEKIKILNHLSEKFVINGKEYLPDNIQDFTYLERYYIDTHPTFIYNFDGVKVCKEIIIPKNKNLIIFKYSILDDESEIYIEIVPEFAIKGKILQEIKIVKYLTEKIGLLNIWFKNFNFVKISSSTEEKNESYRIGKFYSEKLKKNEPSFLILSIEPDIINDCEKVYLSEIDFRKDMLNKSKIRNEIYKSIFLSLHSYLVYRDNREFIVSGYPLVKESPYLTLRFMNGILYPLKLTNIVKKIFEYYANNEELFKDYQNDSLLWFIHSIYNFIEHTGDWKFVKEKLWWKIKLIINFYLTGQFKDIKIEEDGLLLTEFKNSWREIPGKYVDTNALWYNAIRIVELFAAKFADIDYHLKTSEFGYIIKNSFSKKFFNSDKGYLNNCVDIPPDKNIDSSLRPNQLLALSLPFDDLLTFKTKLKILKIIRETLFSLNGVKTLASISNIFNCNDLNNGAFSIEWWSEFIIAYLKLNKFGRKAKREAYFFITQLEKKFKSRVVGHLPEGLSSDENSVPLGEPASLKSISSFVRVLYEILGKI